MASDDQTDHVKELISQEIPVDGDKPAVDGWLQRVCRTAAREIPAMGVGISLQPTGSPPLPVAASSREAALVEELQFMLGEGPCVDAYALRRPVLTPDLGTATATKTWPAFTPAAHDRGVRAAFAFPMQRGAARLGALDVYRDHTGSLSPEELSLALSFTEVTLEALMGDAGTVDHGAGDLLDDIDGHRFEVYQAQGMVMARLDISAEQALLRLRAHAYARQRRVVDVARDVIARKIELEPDA